MTDLTARLALPLLVPGQAQKEMFHNEALALLDVAVQPSVLSAGLNVAPPAPTAGQCWIVGNAPQGAWTGHAFALAGWTDGGWRFVTPAEGFAVWDQEHGCCLRFAGGGWSVGAAVAARLVVEGVQVVGAQRPAIAAASGGGIVDAEARSAVAAIIEALRGHGLVAS